MPASTTAQSGQPPPQPAPRMLAWGFVAVMLLVVAFCMQTLAPGTVLATIAYKASLMGLGGFGGYWLDRALFPYDRPHQYLQDAADAVPGFESSAAPNDLPPLIHGELEELQMSISTYGHSMLRRAIVVAACLICVGLGA